MAGLSAMPLVLAVNPQLPAASVDELIALAEAEPGRLRFASSGIGGSPHLAAAEFNTLADTEMSHLPFDGSGPAVAAVMAGAADLLFDTTVAALPAVRDGRLRGLAVTSAARSPAAPDLPTLAEAGLPGLEVLSWNGLMVPAGTPAAEVERLHTAIVQAMSAAGNSGGTRLPGCRDPCDHARRVRHGPRGRYRGLVAHRACGRPGGFGMIAGTLALRHRFGLGAVALALLIAAAAPAMADAQATPDPFQQLNDDAIGVYRDAKERFHAAADPVVIVGFEDVMIRHRGQTRRVGQIPPAYQILKANGHAPRSIWAALRPAVDGLDPDATWRGKLTELRPRIAAARAALPVAGLPPPPPRATSACWMPASA